MRKTIFFFNNIGDNAGDYYCSPKLYYNFDGFDVIHRTLNPTIFNTLKDEPNFNSSYVIFGGGGIIDTNSDIKTFYDTLPKTNIYFHWGSGSNRINLNQVNWKINDKEIKFVDSDFENFKLIGRRDYIEKYKQNHSYVPCVSCKLPQLKKKYINQRRIGIVQHAWLKQINLNYPTINMNLSNYDIDNIIKFIGESEIIITGSFHGAYFGLLMGKTVLINGNWSSKFDTFKYKPTLLTNDIEKDIVEANIAPNNYLDECIELNDNFYKKILTIISE